jgi:dipeptidyl aminopeptidase/acylaminoacyl peptidase
VPMTPDAIAVATPRITRRGILHSSRRERLLCLLLTLGLGPASVFAGGPQRRFTVTDDIEFSHFGDPFTARAEPVTFSPDGRYFVVDTERGRIDLNRPESILRVYRTVDVERWLGSSESEKELSPLWTVAKSAYRDGPIITSIRWLADSSGFAFLAKNSLGNDQLFLGEVNSKRILALSQGEQQVTSFDIRNRGHYVYCVQSPALRRAAIRERRATSIAANGHNIYGLLFAGSGDEDLHFSSLAGSDLSELWAVIEGRSFLVRDRAGEPIPIRSDGQQALALSPDGSSVVTALAVRNIPPEWETMYRSADAFGAYRIRPGKQDAAAVDQSVSVSEYVRIRLSDGQVQTLTAAPIGSAAGWWAFLKAAWSSDGESVVLPNTFLPPAAGGRKSEAGPPCTAVIEFKSGEASCVARLRGRATNGEDGEKRRLLRSVEFLPGTNTEVMMRYLVRDGSEQTEYYARLHGGSWSIESGETAARQADRRPLEVFVRQDMNAPPVLVGTDSRTRVSKMIWNPNPQLQQIALGEESVFRWKDDTGRDWIGGLYKPPDYVPGTRYPLVIQTHGFRPKNFDPAGAFPTGFAAQELAAAGILVLQVEDCPLRLSAEEAACQIAGYEAAVIELAKQGLIDSSRVGIIGFSRTCYYVMQALTENKLRLRAASITDGMVLGYLEYIMQWGVSNNDYAHEANALIGAPPLGTGLDEWVKHSPEFNLDKVTAPLQVVVRGRPSLLTLWEPYAGLRYLNKPVDLLLLPDTGTHILTNPAQRAASQTATVDWFRFWLKGEVDRDPGKREQYRRWQRLRDLEGANLLRDQNEPSGAARTR